MENGLKLKMDLINGNMKYLIGVILIFIIGGCGGYNPDPIVYERAFKQCVNTSRDFL